MEISRKNFTDEELRQRAYLRLSMVLFELWEEKQIAHSRIFETLIPDLYVVSGSSKNGSDWREHAVPCSVLRDWSYKMFDEGSSVNEVAQFVREHLKIYRISLQERIKLDFEMGLKNKIPLHWKPGNHFERLAAAGIEIIS